jgi:Protein of unknown function (DUF2442)
MGTSTKAPDRFPTAMAADVRDERLRVTLVDGRELSVPITWWDWLAGATDAQRSDLEIIEGGQGIWWDQLEDGLSVPGLFGLPHY